MSTWWRRWQDEMKARVEAVTTAVNAGDRARVKALVPHLSRLIDEAAGELDRMATEQATRSREVSALRGLLLELIDDDLDRVLAKISAEGESSLNEQEQQTLQDATAALRDASGGDSPEVHP